MKNKRDIWIKNIQNYRSSGLTAAKWCDQNGVNIHTLKYHITKINKEKKQQGSTKIKWASVVPDQTETTVVNNNPIKVIVANATIEITRGFDPTALETVIRILTKQC